MKIAARVVNTASAHRVDISTDGRAQALTIPPKPAGRGSGVNGGELLFAALATCFCNDLYREAAARGIPIDGVEVEVTGEFGDPGEPARDVTYRVKVRSGADAAAIGELVRATDAVTEIQNTLRQGVAVRLVTG
jgi:uncharacterized OsmC-like protein